jgi:hypothetical protein
VILRIQIAILVQEKSRDLDRVLPAPNNNRLPFKMAVLREHSANDNMWRPHNRFIYVFQHNFIYLVDLMQWFEEDVWGIL